MTTPSPLVIVSLESENVKRLAAPFWPGAWPRNVWAGCTVEDQKRANERIPHLLRVPAAVRFLSCEPLLGAVDLVSAGALGCDCRPFERDDGEIEERCSGRCAFVRNGGRLDRIAWVIVGGESGGGARPFHLAWARSIVAQCKAAKVATFVKQLGAHPHDRARDELGNTTRPALLTLNSRKGDDVAEWPADLRIREWPESAR